MSVVSNGQFWMYTFALLTVWIIVLTTALNSDSINNKNKLYSFNAKSDEDELKNTGNCKSICKHCNCLGFYCGEECLCECNNDRKETECIGEMQTQAKRLNSPFEVLIQGPTANTFVRKAMQLEQNDERRKNGYKRKRSTVTVYKPNKGIFGIKPNSESQKLKSINEDKQSLTKDILKVVKDRQRRSSDQQFKWFNLFDSNLVRPAPLGGYKRKSEEPKVEVRKPMSPRDSRFDNSWFSDYSPHVLTPAPLTKRTNSRQSLPVTDNDNAVEFSLESFDLIDNYLNDNHEKMVSQHHNKLEDIKNENKDSLVAEKDRRNTSQEFPIKNFFKRLFPSKLSNKEIYSPTKENFKKESQESLTDKSEDLFREDTSPKLSRKSLYTKLQQRKLLKNKENYSPAKRENLETHDSLADILDTQLFSDDSLAKSDENALALSKTRKQANKKNLQDINPGGFGLFKDKLGRDHNSFDKRDERGLPEFRIPWFKPANFFRKFKNVLAS